MESWMDVCDDSVKQWSRRWCALEGGYIWFFENPQDNAKPQGLNKVGQFFYKCFLIYLV